MQPAAIRQFIPRQPRYILSLSVVVLSLAACKHHDFPDYPANYREYIYTANSASATVTAIDVVNVRVDREIPVGPNPVALATAPTRNEVYVVSSGAPGNNGSLAIIDAQRNSVAATITLHRQPVSIDIDSAGNLAYIANQASNSVSIVDLKLRRQIAEFGTGVQPAALRLSPDGKTLAVSNRGANSVTLFDLPSARLRAVFPGCPAPAAPVFMPDSSKLFIPCSAGHQVMVLALAVPADKSPDHSAHPDQLQTFMDVGRGPIHLALKPDSGELFVSNSLANSISEVVTSTNDVGGAYMIGDRPVQGLVSADNALLYVANLDSQYVAIYTVEDGKRTGAIHVGDGPAALAFSANNLLLFVADSRSGDVAVVRSATKSLFTLLPTGRNPTAILDKAFRLQ